MAATKNATTKSATKRASTSKKSATKATTKKAAKKATTKKASSSTSSPRPPRILERDPKVLVEDVGYAAAGVAHDAVELARTLPRRVEAWRGEAEQTAKRTPEQLQEARKQVPSRVNSTVKDLRDRLTRDLEARLATLEQRFEGKAAEGRKVAETVRTDERVQRVLEQTGNTRSQVKAALTSIVRTGEAAAEAGRDQATVATSQVKAAATSARRSAETLGEAASNGTES